MPRIPGGTNQREKQGDAFGTRSEIPGGFRSCPAAFSFSRPCPTAVESPSPVSCSPGQDVSMCPGLERKRPMDRIVQNSETRNQNAELQTGDPLGQPRPHQRSVAEDQSAEAPNEEVYHKGTKSPSDNDIRSLSRSQFLFGSLDPGTPEPANPPSKRTISPPLIRVKVICEWSLQMLYMSDARGTLSS
jgi:hypothetical protein